MRYEISISVDENKLFGELYGLIENRWNSNPKICGQQVGYIKNSLINGDIREALRAIHAMRSEMFDFDSMLDDVSHVLDNYLNYATSEGIEAGEE